MSTLLRFDSVQIPTEVQIKIRDLAELIKKWIPTADAVQVTAEVQHDPREGDWWKPSVDVRIPGGQANPPPLTLVQEKP